MLNYYLNYEKMYVHTKFAIILAVGIFMRPNLFDKNMLTYNRKKFKYIDSYLFFT